MHLYSVTGDNTPHPCSSSLNSWYVLTFDMAYCYDRCVRWVCTGDMPPPTTIGGGRTWGLDHSWHMILHVGDRCCLLVVNRPGVVQRLDQRGCCRWRGGRAWQRRPGAATFHCMMPVASSTITENPKVTFIHILTFSHVYQSIFCLYGILTL